MFWNLTNKKKENRKEADEDILKKKINNFLFFEDSYGYYLLNNTFNLHIASYGDSLSILKSNDNLSFKKIGTVRIEANYKKLARKIRSL